jgi:hypothetical protein
LVFFAKQSVEEAVDVGLAGSLAVDAAVVEAIVVVEVGLVTTLVEDATPAVVVVEAIVVVEVGLVTTLVDDATPAVVVVEAIVVVEVGLVKTLVDDATPAVVVVEAIVVVEVGLVTTLVEDATLLIVDVHVKEAILLIVDALAALCFCSMCCRRINRSFTFLRNLVISAVSKLKCPLLLTRAISEVSKSFFEKGCLRINIIANIHWITTSPHSVFPSC